MKLLLRKIICFFTGHNWESNLDKHGYISELADRFPQTGFKWSCSLFCRRCGAGSKLNMITKEESNFITEKYVKNKGCNTD